MVEMKKKKQKGKETQTIKLQFNERNEKEIYLIHNFSFPPLNNRDCFFILLFCYFPCLVWCGLKFFIFFTF